MVVGRQRAAAGRSGRRGAGRRDLLVQAAFNTIAEKGFEGLRLREVAAQAGIDHSTLHYHFPTRKDLVTAVVEFATSQFWTATPGGGTNAQNLPDHLAILARMIQQRPALFIVLRELDLRASRDPAVREIIERYEQGWRTALAGRADDAAVELVIATVKGVSFTPDRAAEVLARLGSLLAQERT
ncbi:MAG: TetR/AcrR family transcriptional regulator [Pseudonocardiaceae bacterium]